MFMSYPVNNHVEIKVDKTAGGSQGPRCGTAALGMIDPEHRKAWAWDGTTSLLN